ncbi:MAG: PhzF family phenazine biosynthesis protein [Planctomycetota bacterium]
MTMPMPMFIVDAFTSERFKGNPAAVCLLDDSRADEWLQDVAREMNLSETAFVRPADEHFEGCAGSAPKVEVDLCGHATLASAHVLWRTGRLGRGQAARFKAARRSAHGHRARVLDRARFSGEALGRCEPPAALARKRSARRSSTSGTIAWACWSRSTPRARALVAARPRPARGDPLRGVIVT